MATLTKEKTGSWSIRFVDEHGNRKSVFLNNKFNEQSANDLKRIIETLIVCRNNNQFPDKRVFTYLETAPPEIQAKLEKAGLIKQSKTWTLGQLWDGYLATKEIKALTLASYATIRKRFFAFFDPDAPVESLTAESIGQWKKHLAKKYKTATVAGSIAKIKAITNWATNEKDLFVKNPAVTIKPGSYRNEDKDRFVTMEEYEKIFSACRTKEQRAILTLARIGGLRIPSEIANLTWADVLWDIGKIWIKSPKTEHHKGKAGRFVPLWEPIRRELEALFFEEDADGKDDRVFRKRDSSSNLRTRFEKIQIRAGLVPIDKFFTNCRASRSSEVEEKYGSIKESLWIGHSEAVAKRHYRRIPDADYKTALLENFEPKPLSVPSSEIGDTFLESKPKVPCFAT